MSIGSDTDTGIGIGPPLKLYPLYGNPRNVPSSKNGQPISDPYFYHWGKSQLRLLHMLCNTSGILKIALLYIDIVLLYIEDMDTLLHMVFII